jgi:hypothetical protein
MSKLEHVVRTLANTRTYSRHLTAASWKLWCRLVNTVDMLFNAVSMNMAFNWILNPLLYVSTPYRLKGFRKTKPRPQCFLYTYLSAFRWNVCPGTFDNSVVSEFPISAPC